MLLLLRPATVNQCQLVSYVVRGADAIVVLHLYVCFMVHHGAVTVCCKSCLHFCSF